MSDFAYIYKHSYFERKNKLKRLDIQFIISINYMKKITNDTIQVPINLFDKGF